MLSLPDTWNYSLKGLISLCKENETAIRSTLKELKEFGYLEVIKKYSNETETHKYEYEYIVYENPKPQGKNQCVEDLCIEDPVVLNTDILNTKIDNSIINNKPELKKQLTAKQKNYITINNMLNEFSKDKKVIDALKKYLKVRTSDRSLNVGQWELILKNLKDECQNNNEYAVELIERATACGWMQIVYNNKFSGKPKTSYSSAYVDNTANHFVGNKSISDEEFNKLNFDEQKNYVSNTAMKDMTKLQREFYKENCLARDENGELLKF